MTMQSELNDWDIVKEQIKRTKIRRFNYKAILGESLTSYVLRLRSYGWNSKKTVEKIMNHPNMLIFLRDIKPEVKKKLLENVKISVASRFAENNMADKYRRKSQ